MSSAATPFESNLDHVEAWCAWVKAVVESAGDNTDAGLQRQRAILALRIQSSVEAGVMLPAEHLRTRFGLTDTQMNVLWTVAASTIDPALGRQIRDSFGRVFFSGMTIGLVRELLGPTLTDRLSVEDALAPGSALLTHKLISLPAARPGTPQTTREVFVPPRICHFLTGRQHLDELIVRYCDVSHPQVRLDQVIIPEPLRDGVLELIKYHRTYRQRLQDWGYPDVLPYGRGIVLLFSGPPGTGKTRLASALANELGHPLIRVKSDQLRESEEAIEPMLEELSRESMVQDALVLFDDCEALFGQRTAKLSALLDFVENFSGVLILATNQPQVLDAAMERRIIHQVDFRSPDKLLREQLWELHLPPAAPLAADIDIGALASNFELTGGAIKNAALVAINKALSLDVEAPVISMELLESAARAQLRYNLEDFTQVAVSPLRLTDVVLPPDQGEQVQELLEACRSRTRVLSEWGFGARLVTGKGVVALFDGPPGTGKTLTAEVLANELGRVLHRVHIPNVVSKWVGETEKHIADIFSRARTARAMLLFDEADSLFGRRTEVKQASDRYANMEVNLMLQEIERFEGITILTTNLFGSLDDAIRRRITYRVSFPEPDLAARELIWRTLTPREAPLAEDIDFRLLAKRFDLSGGLIKNALLRGAHRAMADGGGPIRMEHLVRGATDEARAAGQVVRVMTKTEATPQ